MGRKSSSKKGGGEGRTPSRQQQSQLQQQQEATSDVEAFLSARLVVPLGAVAPRHPQQQQQQKDHPRVLLAAPDADRLDVMVRENVLVLSFTATTTSSTTEKEDDEEDPEVKDSALFLQAAALLPAEIGAVSSNNSNSKSIIAPGTIQITSAFLTDRLLSGGRSPTPEATLPATPTTPIIQQQSTTTPISTSTSTSAITPNHKDNHNKPHFSFKIGGGGDTLYASTGTASTPSPRGAKTWTSPSCASSSSQKKRPVLSTQIVTVLPARSILGQQLVQVLCTDCQCLVLEPVRDNHHDNDDNDNDPSEHGQYASLKDRHLILQRLVVAHTRQRYVQPLEILHVSVAGRSTYWRVVQCQSTRIRAGVDHDPDTKLNETLQQLCLNDSSSVGDDAKIPRRLHSIIANAHWREPLLYQIGYDTIIEFVTPSDPPTCRQQPTSTLPPHLPLQPIQPPRVVGLDATLAECRALLTTPLLHPKLFVRTKPPRGILLHGPSGVGKTALARQLADEFQSLRLDQQPPTKGNKNVAITVEYVHCAALLSQTNVVGQAERYLTRLFHVNNRSNSSSAAIDIDSPRARLIILDDLHLIGAKRGSHHAGADRLVATLLALLDGITTTGPSSSSQQQQQQEQPPAPVLMVLGITNNLSMLDTALRRPGRLDVEVPVPLPDDAATRARILQFHYGNLMVMGCTTTGDNNDADKQAPTFTEAEWLELGTLAKGFNGADCVLAIKEAIRMSLLAQHVVTTTEQQQRPMLTVSMHHLRTAIRATKPSAIKSITVEIPRVLWSAIGGMDAVKTELREAIELPITHHDFFEQLRVPPPRGILLYGPPGCSKTLMARALATEGHMNFLAVKGPELLSKWLGESERALASLFRRARMACPCIIFFDEIDAIASKRGGSSDSASSGRLLSQLLTELDGIHHPMGIVSNRNTTTTESTSGEWKDQRVVVVGATNRPDLLDPALTRPGRIDCKIYVGVPDEASRSRILELSLQDRSCDADIDVSQLARDSDGCSGAEMVALCRDAALLALEESDRLSTASAAQEMPSIAMRHLVQALQDTQRQITPEMIDFYASYRDNTRR